MDKAKKYKHCNDLFYDSVHNFDKYSVMRFNEISSIESKFNVLNRFYIDLTKLNAVKSQNNKTKQKKKKRYKRHYSSMRSWLIHIGRNTVKLLKSKIRFGGENMIIKI